ncbi:MAG: hypothetical protein M1546_09835 [Chloroflexi bacterium]|nr:hypothetical protein [Chloroflexota bacterium]
MTERSIAAGATPDVVVRAGADATILGYDGDRVTATAEDRRGLKLEARKGGIDVSAGGNCVVHVPFGSTVKVYTGATARVNAIRGQVSVVAGAAATLNDVDLLVNLSAGGDATLDCGAVEGRDVKFTAGRDLRCHIRDLPNATVTISDIGGKWEVTFGESRRRIQLKAGGDVTLVTDQTPARTSTVAGRIEKPKGSTE